MWAEQNQEENWRPVQISASHLASGQTVKESVFQQTGQGVLQPKSSS